MTVRTRSLVLAAILLASAGVRLYRLDAPMADSLLAKQAYVANRARSIAQTPINPLRNSLDFLDADGQRMAFTDEIPLYHTLLAIGYRLLGEHDWVGHSLSLVGSLVALAAFFDLTRRERDDVDAVVGTILLSAAPLFVFYGRAVLPEPWMLASMLASAASYRRYLDSGRTRWLVLTTFSGLCAGLFKYFGLMVFLPLTEMTVRHSGTWKSVFSRSFLAMSGVILGTMALWMGLVFFQTANPIQSGWVDGIVHPYFSVQAPGVFVTKGFWAGLTSRFLVRDCGPVTTVLLVLGVVSSIVRRKPPGGYLAGWTTMGLLFYVLLAPKFLDHDYYELMMLPAAALWATIGLRAMVERLARPERRMGFGVAVLMLAVVVQSPWISGGFFRQDEGKLALAARLRALSHKTDRVVTIGPGIEFPTVVHYSFREGWPVHSTRLPEDWQARLETYRNQGARFVAVYFEPKATTEERASYAPLLKALPVVEHHKGTPARSGGPCEFTILALRDKSGRK